MNLRNLQRIHWLLALWSALLVIGCSIIDIDKLEEGVYSPLRFSSRHAPYARDEIIFSHELHSRIECGTCHGASVTSEAVLNGDLPPMSTCFQCHNGVEKSQTCETCHVVNRSKRKPEFHDAQWLRHHKDMAVNEAYKCALCHPESSCQQCHSTWKPQSHTLRFNRSTHGRFAIQDRRSCATCHQTDFCENCHRQPPPDHTPTFMGRGPTGEVGHKQMARVKLRACLTCHDFQDACSRCHS